MCSLIIHNRQSIWLSGWLHVLNLIATATLGIAVWFSWFSYMIQIIRTSLMVCEGTIPDHSAYLLQGGLGMGTKWSQHYGSLNEYKAHVPSCQRCCTNPFLGVSTFTPITSLQWSKFINCRPTCILPSREMKPSHLTKDCQVASHSLHSSLLRDPL